MPRLLLAVVVLTIALPRPAHAGVPVLVVDGRGFGHGVGMAQDGAHWMGRDGADTTAILRQFYPGTSLGTARGSIRVPVVDAGPAPAEVVLSFPHGGLVRDAPPQDPARHIDVRVPPGGDVGISWDGTRYRVRPRGGTATAKSGAGAGEAEPTPRGGRLAQAGPLPTAPPSSTTTTAPDPVPTDPPGSTTTTTSAPTTTTTTPRAPAPDGPSSTHPVWSIPDRGGVIGVPARENRRYRGAIEATGSETLRLVNEVDVETYLRGMGEVRDPSWPPASLRAQAIAARTYALRAMAVGGEICDTQRCQVYLGADAEYGAMSKAVADTSRQVLTFGRSLASAVYSANGGGHSASREEGFGQSGHDYPYLRPAPYPTADPEPWTAEIALRDVASRLGYPGEISGARVAATGPSGRAQTIVIDGSAGEQAHTGLAFADALRLRSTLFVLGVGSADTAPAPPEGDSFIQAPPEVAAAIAAHEMVGPDLLRDLPLAASTAPEVGGPGGDPVGGLALWATVVLLAVAATTAAAVAPTAATPDLAAARAGIASWVRRRRGAS